MITDALIAVIVIVVMLAVIALCFHVHIYRDMKRKQKIREQHEERQRQQMDRWQQYVTTTLDHPVDEEHDLPPAYYDTPNGTQECTAPVLPPPAYKYHNRDVLIR